MDSAFIAIDWGTTNRRAFLIEDAAVRDSQCDDRGVLAMDPTGHAAEVAALRSRWGNQLVLVAGMAGSNRGWAEVPYARCPARIEDLAGAIHWIEPGRTAIIPGLCQRHDGGDVMRGEEVQFFGALATGDVPADALLCQPGTHSKWARLSGGAITSFATAMTGEMFALLRHHSLLSAQLQGEVAAGEAFSDGVADARESGLLTALFRIRSASLLGLRNDQDAASYASGLLIGCDVGSRIGGSNETVYLIADAPLGALYALAIEQLGGTAILVDSEAAFVSGISALRMLLP